MTTPTVTEVPAVTELPTVIEVFRHLLALSRNISVILGIIRAPHPFRQFENDFTSLHHGITAILQAIGRNPLEMRDHGLRLLRSDWENLPDTVEEGLQELRGTMTAVIRLLNETNVYYPVEGFGDLSEALLGSSMDMVWIPDEADGWIHPNAEQGVLVNLGRNEQGSGASQELIDSLGIAVAAKKHVDEGLQCAICMESISEGQEIRVLPCSHVFHRTCVDGWLRINAICPNDRVAVFEDSASATKERALVEGRW